MLVLTRRLGESLIIGQDIKVTILAVRGNQVRFGIQAPAHIAIHREEVYQRIQKAFEEEDNARASSLKFSDH